MERNEIIVGSILVLITFILISLQLPAHFFDLFGFTTFSFLFYVGYLIRTGRKVPKILGFVLLLIAVLGIIVDGSIVIQHYLLN